MWFSAFLRDYGSFDKEFDKEIDKGEFYMMKIFMKPRFSAFFVDLKEFYPRKKEFYIRKIW